LRERN